MSDLWRAKDRSSVPFLELLMLTKQKLQSADNEMLIKINKMSAPARRGEHKTWRTSCSSLATGFSQGGFTLLQKVRVICRTILSSPQTMGRNTLHCCSDALPSLAHCVLYGYLPCVSDLFSARDRNAAALYNDGALEC